MTHRAIIDIDQDAGRNVLLNDRMIRVEMLRVVPSYEGVHVFAGQPHRVIRFDASPPSRETGGR